MNRYVKYGLFALAALMALVAVLIGVIAATFNPNDYKPLIIKLVQEKKQRTLKLDGDIKLAFFPRIGADLGKVSLSEHNAPQEFASVENLSVSLELLPLLQKKLVVNRVQVTGVKARIVRFKDGSTNIDDLLKKEESNEQFKFDIDSVKVADSSLTLEDQMAGRTLAVSQFNLKTGRIANAVPTDIETDFSLQSSAPRAQAKISLSSGLMFDLEGKHYVLDGLKAKLAGDAAGFSGLDLQAAGNVDADLKGNLFKVAKLKATLKGKQDGNAIEATLEAPKINISADRAEGEKVTLDAKIARPDGAINAKVSMPGVEGSAKALKISALTLELDGKQGNNSIKGEISTPVSGNLETRQFDFSRLAANLTVGNPSFPNGKLAASLAGAGSLDLAKPAVALNLSGKLDESNIQARLGLSRFTPPVIDFDIGIDQLNVDRYAPPGTNQGGAEKPLDFSALRNLNANGSLRIGTLQMSGIKASNVRLDMKADGGDIKVNPLSANLYQGTLAGSADLNAHGATPQLSLNQKLSGVSVGPLLRDVAHKDVLEGHGDVTLNVSTSGGTVSAMKRALSGNATVNLRDGAIKGINLAQTLRNAKAKLASLRGQQTVSSNASEKTDFTELTGSFAIHNGIAHNEDLSVKSPLLRVGGNGDVNIPGESLNYLVKTTVVGTLEGQGGQEMASLKGVTIPIRVSGPFDKLAYTLDFNAMIGEQAKQKVEEKKEQVREKARDELKKGLKDLFKR